MTCLRSSNPYLNLPTVTPLSKKSYNIAFKIFEGISPTVFIIFVTELSTLMILSSRVFAYLIYWFWRTSCSSSLQSNSSKAVSMVLNWVWIELPISVSIKFIFFSSDARLSEFLSQQVLTTDEAEPITGPPLPTPTPPTIPL